MKGAAVNSSLPFASEAASAVRKVSDFIHDNPELGYKEFQASAKLKELLRSWGFRIEENVCGLETAFKAYWESTDDKNIPVFCFMGEYDALAGLGHGCGHNLIAAASLFAAYAAKRMIETDRIPARICYIGTPAEEGLGGKVKLVAGGAFQDIAAGVIAHPLDHTSPDFGCLSVARAYIDFYGRASHAAFAPEEGINALDALVAFYDGILEWKKTITERQRVHGIFTKGGDAANIIPDHTQAFFYIRAGNESEIGLMKQRLESIASGAAAKTGCRTAVNWVSAYKGMVFNKSLNDEFIRGWRKYGVELKETNGTEGRGSTDTGDVSYVIPCAHYYFGVTGGIPAALHTVEFREFAKTDEAFEAAMKTGSIMAQVCLRYFTDKTFREAVHRDFETAEK